MHFVGADDAHGAPIMIAAEKAGKTPQQFVADIAAGRKPYLDGFHIGFDNWHSTDAPENHELAQQIYRDLKADGLIASKTIEQFFDPEKNMFLPDRFIKGECPKCGAKDQYGDNCEVCGAVYAPTDLKNPYSALSGATPVLKSSEHFFFKLSDPRCVDFLEELDAGRPPAARGRQQDPRMVHRATNRRQTSEGLGDWDISRDAPYFGIEIPDAPGKYFYVWLDAPIGYLASLKNLLTGRGERLRRLHGRPGTGAVPLHRQGHHHLPHPVLAGHAAFQRPQDAQQGVRARLPDREQRREDEQEPRHRPGPAQVPGLGMNPEWLRYYLAAKLNAAATRTSTSTPTTSWPGSTATWSASTSTSPAARRFLPRRPAGGAPTAHLRRVPLAHERRRPMYEAREYGKALRETMLLADRVNCVGRQQALGTGQGRQADTPRPVCTVCIEAFACSRPTSSRCCRRLAAQVEAFLKWSR